MAARVILLAAEPAVRDRLAQRVRASGGLVVARYSLSGWTVHEMQRLRPQVVLLVRGEAGERAALRPLAMAASLAPTIVCDDCRRAEWLAQLLLCGAWGVAPAEPDEALLDDSLAAVAAGELAWREGAAARAARAILQAHQQGQLARLKPTTESTLTDEPTCAPAARKLLLAQLSSLPDRPALVELSLALGLSLTDLEERLDWVEQAAPQPAAGPHKTSEAPPAAAARPALQCSLRYLVSSLRALRHES